MPPSRAQRARTADRRRRAVDMRIAGATWEQIARQLGYASPGAACTDVKRALEASLAEMHQSVAVMRHQAELRLERLLQAVWPAAMDGDPKAVEQVRGIVADLRRLYGLDEPTRHEVVTLGAVEAEIARLERELAADDGGVGLPGEVVESPRALPPA